MVRPPLQRPQGRSDGVRTTPKREQGRSGGVRTTPKRGSCRFLGSGPPRGHGACQDPCGAQAQHEHTEIPGLPHPPAQETSALRGCGSVDRTGGRRKQKFTTEARRHGAEQRERVGGWPGRMMERANAVRAKTVWGFAAKSPELRIQLRANNKTSPPAPCLRASVVHSSGWTFLPGRPSPPSRTTSPHQPLLCLLRPLWFLPGRPSPPSQKQPPHAQAVPPPP